MIPAVAPEFSRKSKGYPLRLVALFSFLPPVEAIQETEKYRHPGWRIAAPRNDCQHI